MPPETHTDRINKLERFTATLGARADVADRDLKEIRVAQAETSNLLRDADKQLALVARDVERLEKKLDDLLSRRWELWKIILAAFLGSALTLAVDYVGGSLDRWIEAEPDQQVQELQ